MYVEQFGLFCSKKAVLRLLAQRAHLHDAAFFTYLRDLEYMIDMRLRDMRKARRVKAGPA